MNGGHMSNAAEKRNGYTLPIAFSFHMACGTQLTEHLAADLSFLLRSWGLRGER